MATVDLTAQRLREALEYDPETGLFVWKIRTRGAKLGAIAGATAGRYIVIRLDKRLYYAHRLAWLHVYGEWPKALVDHMNGSGTDNRINNLRHADKRTNAENQKRGYGRTGLLGVTAGRTPETWRAQITVSGRTKWLGTYDTPEAAHQAYLTAKRKAHRGCLI